MAATSRKAAQLVAKLKAKSSVSREDVVEQLVDGGQAEGGEHPLAVAGGMGTVGHPVGQPAATRSS